MAALEASGNSAASPSASVHFHAILDLVPPCKQEEEEVVEERRRDEIHKRRGLSDESDSEAAAAELEVLRQTLARPKPLFSPKPPDPAGILGDLEEDELFANRDEGQEETEEELEGWELEETVKREIKWSVVGHMQEHNPPKEPLGPEQSPAWVEAFLSSARAFREPKNHGLNVVVYQKSNPFATDKSRSRFKHPELSVPAASLWFDSHFESANLEKAIMVSPLEYDLYLCNDYNTRGHTQWYYFRLERAIPRVEYSFHIRNFEKAGSLYNEGMLPVFYSERAAREKHQGWRRAGYDVVYYKTSEANPRSGKPNYAISFKLRFEHPDDVCYLAYCVPYTHSDYVADLATTMADPSRRKFLQKEVMCKTLGGKTVDLLTITAPEGHRGEEKAVAMDDRQICFMSARVHPGESNASWMMRGVLRYLTGSDPEANYLRKRFIFKIAPMLNPDGVGLGNYRSSMAGLDLNRQWRYPDRGLTPDIFYFKRALRRYRGRAVFFCDLHGHSRKKDAFMYGCRNEGHTRERIFPYLLSQVNPHFSLQKSSFRVQRSKAGTGRVVVWKTFGIVNCYTLEASLAGSSDGYHFSTKDLEGLGASLCQTLAVWDKGYTAHDPYVKQGARLNADGDLVSYCNLEDAGEASDGGSEPEPTSGNLTAEELKEKWEGMQSETRGKTDQAKPSGGKEAPRRGGRRLSEKEKGWNRSSHPRKMHTITVPFGRSSSSTMASERKALPSMEEMKMMALHHRAPVKEEYGSAPQNAVLRVRRLETGNSAHVSATQQFTNNSRYSYLFALLCVPPSAVSRQPPP